MASKFSILKIFSKLLRSALSELFNYIHMINVTHQKDSEEGCVKPFCKNIQ